MSFSITNQAQQDISELVMGILASSWKKSFSEITEIFPQFRRFTAFGKSYLPIHRLNSKYMIKEYEIAVSENFWSLKPSSYTYSFNVMVFQRNDKGGKSSVPCDHWVTTFEQDVRLEKSFFLCI